MSLQNRCLACWCWRWLACSERCNRRRSAKFDRDQRTTATIDVIRRKPRKQHFTGGTYENVARTTWIDCCHEPELCRTGMVGGRRGPCSASSCTCRYHSSGNE